DAHGPQLAQAFPLRADNGRALTRRRNVVARLVQRGVRPRLGETQHLPVGRHDGARRHRPAFEAAGQLNILELPGIRPQLHGPNLAANVAEHLRVATQQARGAPPGTAGCRAGPWGETGVNEVDVKGEEHRAGPDSLLDLGHHRLNAALQQLFGGDQMKTQRPRAAAVLRAIQRTADAELHGPSRIDQAFFDGAPAPGAMGVALAPIAVPGVGVGVEVDQADRPVARGDGPQLAQRDRVVAPDREWDDAGLQDRAKSVDHDLVTDLDVARDDGQVAG